MLKSPGYRDRFYRRWSALGDLRRCRIACEETDLYIRSDKALDKEFLRERIRVYRRQITAYAQKDPRFFSSLKPLAVERDAPLIVREMASAAGLCNVGPMAAVAGALAQFLGRDLLRRGLNELIIENGGDIFMVSKRARTVAVYAGNNRRWRSLRLKIKPQDTPLGICTSSGMVGHSLSFGRADAAVVISRRASLADAAATATANRVQSPQDAQEAVQFARSIRGISGAIVLIGHTFASWGRLEFTA
ncbi:MAG: UPF0280 family protein [Candidatus Omnitrophica bacterium]|nr:UPF0280 family protein [Candidatus Omnitrophota bacterium]